MTFDSLSLAIVSTLAALLFLGRILTLRQITRHAWAIDLIFTIIFAYLLRGTLGGMAGAIMAGLVLSITLYALRAALAAYDRARQRAHVALGYRVRITRAKRATDGEPTQ